MDDITDTLVERAAEKIARDHRNLKKKTATPKIRSLIFILGAFTFVTGGYLIEQSTETRDKESYQVLQQRYSATQNLLNNLETIKVKSTPSPTGCQSLYIHIDESTFCSDQLI